MKRLVGFGESHLGALVRASQDQQLLERLGIDLTCLSFRDYEPILDRSSGGLDINREFATALRKQVQVGITHPLLFCSIGGGDHVVLGMVKQERQFDFIVPPSAVTTSSIRISPLLSITADTEIVPYDLIVNTMRWRVNGCVLFINWARSVFDFPICFLCVPPPIKDEDFIRQHPGGLRQQIEAHGINPISLRYKLWWVQATIQREICAANNAIFIPVPPEGVDEIGCLREEFNGGDPVHANGGYGELVIKQLFCLSNAGGWRPAHGERSSI
jgi:hypothetical protein